MFLRFEPQAKRRIVSNCSTMADYNEWWWLMIDTADTDADAADADAAVDADADGAAHADDTADEQMNRSTD